MHWMKTRPTFRTCALRNFSSMESSEPPAAPGSTRPAGWLVLLGAFCVAAIPAAHSVQGQPPPRFRGGPPGAERLSVIKRFDWDGNGRLDSEERARARAYVKARREETRRGRRGFRFGRPPEDEVSPGEAATPERLDRNNVPLFPGKPLYERGILRTLFLDFAVEDWEEELEDFYRTDVEVPADLWVDGKKYPGVGVRFRGNSSFFTVARGRKRSFNISIDHTVPGLRLYGYKTLNLLNSHSDPSFLRTVLFYEIHRRYAPAPKANLVRVAINGESWGVYVNVQQYNRDFIEEWFGTRRGARWKIPARPFDAAALRYLGEDAEEYKRHFELKAADDPAGAWKALIHFCRVLNETPIERLPEELPDVLAVDGALWFLALDSVFMDGDGYLSRGSDFALYMDPGGRFHLLPYDSNETFGIPGGPGRGRGPRFRGPPPERGGPPFGLPSEDGRAPERPRRFRGPPRELRFDRSPLADAEAEDVPLVSRLLAVPEWRARYLAHVRTLLEEALDWKIIGPLAEEYHRLIAEEVRKDTRKLYPVEALLESLEGEPEAGRGRVPSLRRFVEERRAYLLKLPELNRPYPRIARVSLTLPGGRREPYPSDEVGVEVEVTGDCPASEVLLHYSPGRTEPFRPLRLSPSGDRTFKGSLPGFPAGTRVRYYVEARAPSEIGTVAFRPASTEFGALSYRVQAPERRGFPVAIVEAATGRPGGPCDPDGEPDDRIRLYNASDKEIDLSGMYLSDDPDEPRKWRFPEGSVIVGGGYLVVWADGDRSDERALHAAFKLKEGEVVVLSARDEEENALLARREVSSAPKEAPAAR